MGSDYSYAALSGEDTVQIRAAHQASKRQLEALDWEDEEIELRYRAFLEYVRESTHGRIQKMPLDLRQEGSLPRGEVQLRCLNEIPSAAIQFLFSCDNLGSVLIDPGGVLMPGRVTRSSRNVMSVGGREIVIDLGREHTFYAALSVFSDQEFSAVHQELEDEDLVTKKLASLVATEDATLADAKSSDQQKENASAWGTIARALQKDRRQIDRTVDYLRNLSRLAKAEGGTMVCLFSP